MFLASPHINQFSTPEVSEVLPYRQHIGEDLGRMIIVRKAVPNGNPGVLCEILDRGVFETTELYSIEHPSKNPRRILYVLFFAEMDVVFAEELRMGSLVARRNSKSTTRTRGGFLEDQCDVPSFQKRLIQTNPLFTLQVGGEVQEKFDLFRSEILQRQKTASS